MAKNLVQEIDSEFLTCKVCFEPFEKPKSLACLHTFCEKCLEGHLDGVRTFKYGNFTEFNCPVCRKPTQLPLGGVRRLPDNFLVSSLTEMVERQRNTDKPCCEICKMLHKTTIEAKGKCVECSKILCQACVEKHKNTSVTKNHSVYDIETEKEIICKQHEDEVVRFFCEPCESCICVLCTFEEHADHEIVSFKDGVSKHRSRISDMLQQCKTKAEDLQKGLEMIRSVEKIIGEVEQEIHDVAQQFTGSIRLQEKNMVQQLHDMFGEETGKFLENKNEMREVMDSLQSTLNLAELVIKGKEIEFLLLKRQLNEKLSMFTGLIVDAPPSTSDKQPFFVQGSVTLGYLEDSSGRIVRFQLPEEAQQREDDERSSVSSDAQSPSISSDHGHPDYGDKRRHVEIREAGTNTDEVKNLEHESQTDRSGPVKKGGHRKGKHASDDSDSESDSEEVTFFYKPKKCTGKDSQTQTDSVPAAAEAKRPARFVRATQTELTLCQRKRKPDTPNSTPTQGTPVSTPPSTPGPLQATPPAATMLRSQQAA